MQQKPFTVIGYFEDNGQSVCEHVQANNGIHAFWVAAQAKPTLTMVVALLGHLTECEGSVIFPGEGVVDAKTIIDQPEVFGPDDDEHRYITGNWGHIFAGSKTERDLRFVFDTTAQKVVAMQILTGRGYENATSDAIADVQDSLLTANEDVLENPEENNLEATSELPDWSVGLVSAS